MLALLADTCDHPYASEIDREERVVLFSRGGMQARAGEVEGGLIRVIYESAPHHLADEFCTPEQAAVLIVAIMGRQQLCRVPKPDA
jgi:hypothetical protein